PAVRARSAADEGRRLQRAHGALRRDGAIDRSAGADRRGPRVRARRVLLPRLARGLRRRGERARALAASGPHVQPVPGRRHARPAPARRPRSSGRDPAAHRQAEDGHPRSRPRAQLDSDPRRPRFPVLRAPARAVPRPRRPHVLGDDQPGPMIAVEHLVKRYGTFTAVDGVSLAVEPGQIHGFLGPNGAGKTATIPMIGGLLKTTAGRILVNGHDLAIEPEQAKASLGFIPDRPFIYEKLTAGEFLRFHAGLYGLDDAHVAARVTEMLELFELGRWEHELVESFSHGMKQRLVMSAGFMHRPRAVLLDEPMVRPEPRGARLIKDVFRKMAGRGVAILMSTHTLEVAQEMCDLVSIILKGKIIAHGTVAELRALEGDPSQHLTEVFLRLTGGSGLQEIDDAL